MVDVGQIFLRDIAHLYLLTFGEANDVVAIVAQVVSHLSKELRAVVAMVNGQIGKPQVLTLSLISGLCVGIAPFPAKILLAVVFLWGKVGTMMFERQCRHEEVESSVFLQFVELFEIESFCLLFTIFIEHVAHTGFVTVAPVAVFVEPVFQSLGSAIEIHLWQEVKDLPTRVWIRSRAAGYEHAVAPLSVDDSCLQSEVCHKRVVCILLVVVHGHLIFSWHGEGVSLSNKSRGELLNNWVDIKSLLGHQSASVVDHHIAHRIATATSCGESHFFEFAQCGNSVAQVYVVDLYFLPCGDMQVRGRYLASHIGHLGQLLGCDESARTTHAKHVVLVFALLVDAHRHTVALQLTGFNVAGLIFLDE